MKTTEMKLQKRVSQAFGKKIFLLGKFKDGKLFWLKEAEWDCGWYWGFGYLESYTNNENPERSHDITIHQHYNSICFKKLDTFVHSDVDKQCWRLSSDYIRILKDNPAVAETVLSEAEQWELSDLMKTFYTLKDCAALYHSGNSYLTENVKVNLKDQREEKRINKVLLPQVFQRIYEILTPKETDRAATKEETV